jgi:GTP:adenosylcobinamide-phosphate guanylyltransferase
VNWIFAVKGQVADPAAALKEALKQILTSVGLQHGPLEERQVKKVAEAFLGRAPIDTDEPLLQAIQKLRLHKHNKGSWLTKAFIDDLRNQKITIRPATDDSSQWALARKKDSAIRQIDRYMSDLPVIRLVSGRKPFIVVHADMPLSDQELLSRAQEGEDLNLTESQFKRAIWWRAEDKEQPDPVREASSILVITGHSIIRSAPNKAVRQDRNTVNLDVAAHAMNTFLVLNVTTREAKFSNPDQLQKLDTKDQGRLEEVAARINSQMQAVKRQHKSLIDDKNGLRYQQRSWASRLFYYKPKVRKPELKPAGQGPLASTEKPAEKGEPRSRRNLVALDPARQEEKASSGPFAGLRQFFKPKGPGAAN